MPLPYGWDHEAIAAKLRVLGKEGYPSKQRYAIAMDSARSDWMDTHGSAPLPGHLKRVGGIGAKRVTSRAAANMAKGKRRNRSAGRSTQGIPRGQLKRVIKELRIDGWRLASQDENGRHATVLVDHPEFGLNHPIKVWATDAPPPSFQSSAAKRNRTSGGAGPVVVIDEDMSTERRGKWYRAYEQESLDSNFRVPVFGYASGLGGPHKTARAAAKEVWQYQPHAHVYTSIGRRLRKDRG